MIIISVFVAITTGSNNFSVAVQNFRNEGFSWLSFGDKKTLPMISQNHREG